MAACAAATLGVGAVEVASAPLWAPVAIVGGLVASAAYYLW